MALMSQQAFDRILRSLSLPIYVYVKSSTGYTCDRLDLQDKEKKEFNRSRYLITGKQQCSCISWMKDKDCTHLKMLRGDFTMPGVSFSIARDYAEEVMSVLADIHPDSVSLTGPRSDETLDLSELVPSLTLEFDKLPKDVSRICFKKSFGADGVLGVTIKSPVE